MKKIDIQELLLHILEEDTNREFISNYQMYLIHNHLLKQNLFSDFGEGALWRLTRNYKENMQLSENGIQIIHIKELREALSANLRFSKSDDIKILMTKVWSDVKDK